ncbi:unnamed protein product, partial [Phaeothamnion confervicola]
LPADSYLLRAVKAFNGFGLVPGMDLGKAAAGLYPIGTHVNASAAAAANGAVDPQLAMHTSLLEAASIFYVQLWADSGKDDGGKALAEWRQAHAEALAALPAAGRCDPHQWTFEERKMLCAGLLAQGAPGGGVEDAIDVGAWHLMEGRAPEDGATLGPPK